MKVMETKMYRGHLHWPGMQRFWHDLNGNGRKCGRADTKHHKSTPGRRTCLQEWRHNSVAWHDPINFLPEVAPKMPKVCKKRRRCMPPFFSLSAKKNLRGLRHPPVPARVKLLSITVKLRKLVLQSDLQIGSNNFTFTWPVTSVVTGGPTVNKICFFFVDEFYRAIERRLLFLERLSSSEMWGLKMTPPAASGWRGGPAAAGITPKNEGRWPGQKKNIQRCRKGCRTAYRAQFSDFQK